MSLEPPELVALKRALGRQLAALRQAAEIGQQQVARRTGYSRSSVAHAEAGRHLLTRDFWQVADELVAADGALLTEYTQVQAARQEHERQRRETELAEALAATRALRATTAPQPPCDAERLTTPTGQDAEASRPAAAGAAPGDQLYEQLTKLLRGGVNVINRRTLLQLQLLGCVATIAAAAPAVHEDAEERERLDRAVASPNRVDAQVIEHIESTFHHCKLQEDALGSRVVLPTVLAQRDLIHDLLGGCPAPLRPRLLSVYSDMSTSVGYYFLELNDLDNARHHHEEARAAAHEAGNVELSIYALCEWSYTESWRGRAATGIDLAAVAHSLVSRTEDPLMRAGAAQRAATAFAFDGQYTACMVELEKARDSLASAGQVSVESPMYFFNDGYLASHRSECLLRLGKPQEAAASAGDALTLYDTSFADGYAICTLHLGNAHLQSEEIDEAAQVVGNAAELAIQTHSARLREELRTTRTRMQPWRNTPAVKALDERLAELRLTV